MTKKLRGRWLLVIEPVDCGSNSILKVRFLDTLYNVLIVVNLILVVKYLLVHSQRESPSIVMSSLSLPFGYERL